VTLRDVGRRLGVSRTALYRHFADKAALLAAVARQGFQTFSRELQEAWDAAGGGMTGFRAMGAAYVRFAVANPAHYRIMFGRFKDLCESDAALAGDASASFQVLLDALAALERDGAIPAAGDRNALGHFVWASMHGVAMLSIDGQLGPTGGGRRTECADGGSGQRRDCRKEQAGLSPPDTAGRARTTCYSYLQPACRRECSASRSCPPGGVLEHLAFRIARERHLDGPGLRVRSSSM
jgi:AcrR family transcriptional regulator